jgi:hypothetical protein
MEQVSGYISDYRGTLFSHVAAVYRPGERDLAVEFVEALGCVAADTRGMSDSGSPFISVHPNPDDRDPLNNVFYLSQMMPQQLALERALQAQLERDATLRGGLEAYREAALASPASIPHFALNFPSMAALEPVLETLTNGLRPELAERVGIKVFRPGDPGAMGGKDCTIAFVYTDIIVSGMGGFGQLIELQGRPRKLVM